MAILAEAVADEVKGGAAVTRESLIARANEEGVTMTEQFLNSWEGRKRALG